MKHANKLWETHRTMERDTSSYTAPILHNTQPSIDSTPHIAMSQQHKKLTFIVGEADGEHTVEGRVVGFRADSGGALQIRNEWGRFLIPISAIVRVF